MKATRWSLAMVAIVIAAGCSAPEKLDVTGAGPTGADQAVTTSGDAALDAGRSTTPADVGTAAPPVTHTSAGTQPPADFTSVESDLSEIDGDLAELDAQLDQGSADMSKNEEGEVG